jgi:F0F1-type ATP synthase assembly protein I
MVRLYLKEKINKTDDYIEISVWSLIKAYVISNLVIAGILLGVGFLFGILGEIFRVL